MQVIAGKYKGQVLKTPKGMATRPTIGKVKKSLFDICLHELEGCHFLDLFAGSGQMGIEALSRGGASACFVEKGKEAVSCIHSNLKKLNLSDCTDVYPISVERAINKLNDHCFDIIYIDPPYGGDLKFLKLLDHSSIFHPKTRIFLEERLSCKPMSLDHLVYVDERKYGDTVLFELRQRI
ncbi:MAG: 16S rRNA (guanine(966)-N(2))-methyltransferase RsmD [Chlamydiia bacterium]|nr:16S rRNA (guanine(966)-N(2))-methyltransferase RsmD [Chlamydiia bacterium]MCP5509488.1 16S rRNA (guanine(966)-N(2))-methyltransferase RsmD [Chlamydiales bacterium]HPE85469.1 16S rRNA (guanine(966)-N(2))-methyltransferase RsmD [Chlamydiales bacterium]